MDCIRLKDLIVAYDGFLLDAYGVLVTSGGLLPGAVEFLGALRSAGKPFCLISNDASTYPARKVEGWAARGLEIQTDELLTPWQLLASSETPFDLKGRSCALVGSEDTVGLLEAAGGSTASPGEPVEVLVLADETVPGLLGCCDRALDQAVQTYRDTGSLPPCLLVNPDVIYPTGVGFGFTTGALAAMFEVALKRSTGETLETVPVGKPEPHLFRLGLRQLGLPATRVAMLGDQLETDIAGARAAGVVPVLLGTGVTDREKAQESLRPGEFFMSGLD